VPPALGKAAVAVVVVLVRIASLVAISTPSNVELVVTAPVRAPPAKGNLVASAGKLVNAAPLIAGKAPSNKLAKIVSPLANSPSAVTSLPVNYAFTGVLFAMLCYSYIVCVAIGFKKWKLCVISN
jgi:hypothetical protein